MLTTKTATVFKSILRLELTHFFWRVLQSSVFLWMASALGEKNLSSSPEFGNEDSGQLLSNDTLLHTQGAWSSSLWSPGIASPSMELLAGEQAGARRWGPSLFSLLPVSRGWWKEGAAISALVTFNWPLQHRARNEKCWKLAPHRDIL